MIQLVAEVEKAFYEINCYIQSPRLFLDVVSYFEKTYLGPAVVDSEVRLVPAYLLDFRNHFDRVLVDPGLS